MYLSKSAFPVNNFTELKIKKIRYVTYETWTKKNHKSSSTSHKERKETDGRFIIIYHADV